MSQTTNNNLPAITTDSFEFMDGSVNTTVNSRILHPALGLTHDHDKWVVAAIKAAQFDIEEDYIITCTKERDTKGNFITDYHFTIDAVKALAMMARTSQGKEVRNYFIAVEKEYKAIVEAERNQLASKVAALTITGSLSKQAVHQQYYPANEIKTILKLRTSPQVIRSVSDYHMVRTIEVGVRTYIHLTDFIRAWDVWKSESELKSITSKYTYIHIFSNIVFEA